MDQKIIICNIIILCYGLQAYGGEIKDLTKPCKSKNGQDLGQSVTIQSVTMDNCDQNDDFCVAYIGVAALGQINFTTIADVNTLTCSLHAQLPGGGPWLPFPNGCAKDGCKSLSKGKCPLKNDTQATYEISITPPTFAPEMKITGKFELEDGNKTAMCFTFPIQVRQNKKSTPKPSASSTAGHHSTSAAKTTTTPNTGSSLKTTTTPNTGSSLVGLDALLLIATVSLLGLSLDSLDLNF